VKPARKKQEAPDLVDRGRRAKNLIDAYQLVFYYPSNTGKEVIEKYMDSYHSEVAAA